MVQITELLDPQLSARQAYKIIKKVESGKRKRENILSKKDKVPVKSPANGVGKINKAGKSLNSDKLKEKKIRSTKSTLSVGKSKVGNVNLDQKKKLKNGTKIEPTTTSQSPDNKKVKKSKKPKVTGASINLLEKVSPSCDLDLMVSNDVKKSGKITKPKKKISQDFKTNSSEPNHVSNDCQVTTANSVSNNTSKKLGTGIKSSKRKLPKSVEGKAAKKLTKSSVAKKIKKGISHYGESTTDESDERGRGLFKSLLQPISEQLFFKQYWETEYLLIKGGNSNKFDKLITTFDIDAILRKNHVVFTKNIDVTSYVDGKRTTHNPEGRALAPVVWDLYNNGCSVRMLNPQTFHRPVWRFLTTLQEYFNSFCGANVYLTPPGTQGFAPHWDDIEAFILQLEGKKRWRVYKPRKVDETLPRESSGNFGPDDELGEPVLDCILEPGDVLYFPRGFIHQGHTLDQVHSLHITVSTYQKNSWADFLEKLLPAALSSAAEADVDFRRGLPRDYLHHAGIVHSEATSQARKVFKDKVAQMVTRLLDHAPIDAAVDQMAKGFVHDSLPPLLNEDEKRRSIFEGGERWCKKTNSVVDRVELGPEHRIRLVRKGCVRLVLEEDTARLYHSLENSREYHAEEPKYVEVAADMAPGIDALIASYPNYIAVEDLPLATLEDKTTLAIGLWERGIILTDDELEILDE